jgi:pimeloyl-ACP methyl ester carboxylesterase
MRAMPCRRRGSTLNGISARRLGAKHNAVRRGLFGTHRHDRGRPVHYLIGGKGPAVLLVHGYGDTGEMWRPLAPLLAKTHLVIVPDLPGLGDSRPQSPTAPYDMAATARILHGLLLSQNMRRDAVVGHDIGLMAADAYAAAIPKQRDAAGPDGRTEALVAARERIYLDRILDAFAYHPTSGPSARTQSKTSPRRRRR